MYFRLFGPGHILFLKETGFFSINHAPIFESYLLAARHKQKYQELAAHGHANWILVWMERGGSKDSGARLIL